MPAKETQDDVAYTCMLSNPTVVSHLSFKFLRLLLLYSIYLGGGELNQREGEKGNSSQSWLENTNMTDYISGLETPINTCCKVLNRSTF